jgi:hypothetical protein
MAKSPMNAVRDEAHFAQRNPTNPLIKLSNRDSPGTAAWQVPPANVRLVAKGVSEAPLTS